MGRTSAEVINHSPRRSDQQQQCSFDNDERETGRAGDMATAMTGDNQFHLSKPTTTMPNADARALDVTRRNSSLGITQLTENESSHRQSSDTSNDDGDDDGAGAVAGISSVPPLRAEGPRLRPGKVFMTSSSGEPTEAPPFRPMVGGGAAAAYNALRFDFYVQKQKAAQQKRRMSSLSFGSAKASGGRFCNSKNKGGKASSEEQYEMLKLHHLNLMNEIQETALMLNLYEQQQLVRQAQHEEMRKQKLQHIQAKNGRGQSSSLQRNHQSANVPDEVEVGERPASQHTCGMEKKRTFECISESSNKHQK